MNYVVVHTNTVCKGANQSPSLDAAEASDFPK